MMSDGTVWGLALWKLCHSYHRDGRLVSPLLRCCQRLLGAGLTLSLWDLQLLGGVVFSFWHMNSLFFEGRNRNVPTDTQGE
jgi:hypothetical protein